MKRRSSQLLGLFLSFVLCTSLVPTAAFAATPRVITGTYNFVQTSTGTEEVTDTFIFREDCFMRSSYLVCSHLYELSAQATLATGLYMKDNDYSQGDKNIKAMLSAMGFADVETNDYFNQVPLDSSMGVAVGQRTIVDDGTPYTLLAIIPRSRGYGVEWISNVMLGTGDIHEGFKNARDEILRFVKQYVANKSISGNLKLWIAGHSRGAAVANLVGGFFADGGVDYLGSDLSLSPKDIYCYCLATPTALKDGANKSEELSVSANREAYSSDTTGTAWTASDAVGTVSVSNARFKGIHNFIYEIDPVPLLPLADWGYTIYGTTTAADANGAASLDEMIEQYKALGDNQSVYNQLYTDQGNPATYAWSTFDLWKLDISNPSLGDILVDAPHLSDGSIADSLRKHLAGLKYTAADTDAFVNDGYQELFMGLAGIIPYLLGQAQTGSLGNLLDETTKSSLIPGTLAMYLDYARQRTGAASDTEATAIVLRDLITFLAGEQEGISDTDVSQITKESMLSALAQGLVDNKDSQLVQGLVDTLYNGDLMSFVWAMCQSYLPSDEDEIDSPSRDQFEAGLVAFLTACSNRDMFALMMLQFAFIGVGAMGNIPFANTILALGSTQTETLLDVAQTLVGDLLTKPSSQSDQSSPNEEALYDAAQAAYSNYAQAVIDEASESEILKLVKALRNALNTYFDQIAPDDEDLTISQHYQALITINNDLDEKYPSTDTGDNDTTADQYESLAAAADDLLARSFTALKNNAEDEVTRNSFARIATHTAQLRSLLTNVLFTCDGSEAYSMDYNLSVLATLMKNNQILTAAHSCEGYLSWARAVRLNGGLNSNHSKQSGSSGGSSVASVPLYRLYNPNSGEHFYTASAGERDLLVALGWSDEGVGWYAAA